MLALSPLVFFKARISETGPCDGEGGVVLNVTAVLPEFGGTVWRSLKFSWFSLLLPPFESLSQQEGFFPGEDQPLSADGWLERKVDAYAKPRAKLWALRSYRESQFQHRPGSGLHLPRARLGSTRADEPLQISQPRIHGNQAE